MVGMVKLECGCVGFQLQEQDFFLILSACDSEEDGILSMRCKVIKSEAELTPLLPSEIQEVINRVNKKVRDTEEAKEKLQKIQEVVSILMGGVKS